MLIGCRSTSRSTVKMRCLILIIMIILSSWSCLITLRICGGRISDLIHVISRLITRIRLRSTVGIKKEKRRIAWKELKNQRWLESSRYRIFGVGRFLIWKLSFSMKNSIQLWLMQLQSIRCRLSWRYKSFKSLSSERTLSWKS